jgi:hypothetical protein
LKYAVPNESDASTKFCVVLYPSSKFMFEMLGELIVADLQGSLKTMVKV